MSLVVYFLYQGFEISVCFDKRCHSRLQEVSAFNAIKMWSKRFVFQSFLSLHLLLTVWSFVVRETFPVSKFLARNQRRQIQGKAGAQHDTRKSSSLQMVLTPVGPFCPFRSDVAEEMNPRMESIYASTPEFAGEMSKIQVEMQAGFSPDPERLLALADGMDEAVDEWENLMTRLRLSQDFQTREYAKLTQAHLESHGTTTDTIASLMRWQSGCMRALAKNLPPPMPPSDVDLLKLMKESEDTKPPSMTAMTAAEKITSNPFSGTEAAFDSPTVKEEYEQLCRDHSSLIKFGSTYDTFDALGKLAYIDEIEKIEERWDVFFTRFSLLGQLDKEFCRQCNQFLDSMGLDEQSYRKLLKKTHEIMREDAERERNPLY